MSTDIEFIFIQAKGLKRWVKNQLYKWSSKRKLSLNIVPFHNTFQNWKCSKISFCLVMCKGLYKATRGVGNCVQKLLEMLRTLTTAPVRKKQRMHLPTWTPDHHLSKLSERQWENRCSWGNPENKPQIIVSETVKRTCRESWNYSSHGQEGGNRRQKRKRYVIYEEIEKRETQYRYNVLWLWMLEK